MNEYVVDVKFDCSFCIDRFVTVGKAAAQDNGLSERRILTELLFAEIFKELGLNKSDNKRLDYAS